MQTSTTFTVTVQNNAGAVVAPVSALRELSQTELLAVSGGSPKGGWLSTGEGGIEMSSPKGGWQAST